MTDWVGWHDPYADQTTALSRRLRIIQAHLRDWLDVTPPDQPLRALSLCAGDGRDLLGVLAERPDAARVATVLVEINPALTNQARASAGDAGLAGVQVRTADAGQPSGYADCAGADLVLLAGVFGNIRDDDVHQTIAALPMLCAHGAWVIWTRHRNDPDLTPTIRDWFEQAGFVERAFTAPQDAKFTVGVHEFAGTPAAWDPPDPLFVFFR